MDLLVGLPPRILGDAIAGLRTGFPIEFDPTTAPPDQLAAHFLPPRPTLQRAEDNWLNAMRGAVFPLTNDPAALFGILNPALSTLIAPGPTPGAASNASTAQEASQNWSGAYLRRPASDDMALVQASWNVPGISRPRDALDDRYSCSVWVGLDGHDPASRSMPQIGVGVYQYGNTPAPSPAATTVLWWQWWDRHDPTKRFHFVPKVLPTQTGDLLYAQIQALGPNLVSFFIRNLTDHKNAASANAFAAFYESQPVTAAGPGGRSYPAPVVEGQTAAWVVERSLLLPITRFPPLGEFGEVEFTNCFAAMGDSARLQEVDLARARLIRMTNWTDRANPGRVMAAPERAFGRSGFTTRFIP